MNFIQFHYNIQFDTTGSNMEGQKKKPYKMTKELLRFFKQLLTTKKIPANYQALFKKYRQLPELIGKLNEIVAAKIKQGASTQKKDNRSGEEIINAAPELNEPNVPSQEQINQQRIQAGIMTLSEIAEATSLMDIQPDQFIKQLWRATEESGQQVGNQVYTKIEKPQ